MSAVPDTLRGAADAGTPARLPILGRLPLRLMLLLLPAGLLFSILVVCALAVLRLSFGLKHAEWSDWTIASYLALNRRLYIEALFDTVFLAFVSGLAAVVLALPVAIYMVRFAGAFGRRVILVCVLLPMLMNLLVQSYGWIVILGPNGVLNQVLLSVGLIERPILLLFNETGVLLGLVQTTLPLAVLPIASAIRNIPADIEEAAGVLGAPRWRVYLEIVLPLSGPGMAAAFLLVFGFNTGAFVVPMLLGGQRVTTIALVIRDQMGPLLNWPVGAAAAVVLIVIALGVQALRRLIPYGRDQAT